MASPRDWTPRERSAEKRFEFNGLDVVTTQKPDIMMVPRYKDYEPYRATATAPDGTEYGFVEQYPISHNRIGHLLILEGLLTDMKAVRNATGWYEKSLIRLGWPPSVAKEHTKHQFNAAGNFDPGAVDEAIDWVHKEIASFPEGKRGQQRVREKFLDWLDKI
jgi:hypothetical protein